MTSSAFYPLCSVRYRQALGLSNTLAYSGKDVSSHMTSKGCLESETEDEEVKMNCMGGVSGYYDSDSRNSPTESDNEGDKEEDEDMENLGVVNFVGTCVVPTTMRPLVRPKPTTPTVERLSPCHECSEENERSLSSRSSIGARGVPCSFEASTHNDTQDDEREESTLESEDEESLSSEETENDRRDCSESVKIVFIRDPACVVDPDLFGVLDDDHTDDELAEVLQHLEEDRTYLGDWDTSERFIGVIGDMDIPSALPKAKRVLSYNTLHALDIETRGKRDLSKRAKTDHQSTWSAHALPSSSTGVFPLLSDLKVRISYRNENLMISSSDEEDELDRQLVDELNEQERSPKHGFRVLTPYPVPLLTPPDSPLTVEVNGDTTTICEWPSNLVIDNAYMAVSELRLMSPASLQEDEGNVAPSMRGEIEASC